MQYHIISLFFCLNLTILNYCAEEETEIEKLNLQFVQKLQIDAALFQKKEILEYLRLQIEALGYVEEKRELEPKLSKELYKKQKARIVALEQKFAESKKSANQIYNKLDSINQKHINEIMYSCMHQGDIILDKAKLLVYLNYLKGI